MHLGNMWTTEPMLWSYILQSPQTIISLSVLTDSINHQLASIIYWNQFNMGKRKEGAKNDNRADK